MTTEKKKFLDQIGVSYLWSKILEKFASLENRVNEIETAEYVIYGGSASDVMKEDE